MLGPDSDQQARMAAQMDASLDQIERETSAFMLRLVKRWAIRWAIGFAVIFGLTQLVDWLDWLWWVAVPIAVLSLLVPLLFRRFLMMRLAKVRGQMGRMGGGATIDGSWRESTGNARYDTPPSAPEPGTIIIDQRLTDDKSKDGDDAL